MAWGGGMPSAGCDNCRRVKKRCGLEKPACARCVKQKRVCFGYRDVTQLVIRDEGERLRQKYERQQPQNTTARPKTDSAPILNSTEVLNVFNCTFEKAPLVNVEDIESSSDSNSPEHVLEDTVFESASQEDQVNLDFLRADLDWVVTSLDISPYRGIPDKPDDVATNFFFQHFASSGHWDFLRSFQREATKRTHLDLAMQACGMAALATVYRVERGKDYARLRYADALATLNRAIGDPKMSKKDETLTAVLLLGYYENITCDRRQSVRSWQAHIKGAAQLVKLRGKKQFKRPVARQLFRDSRALIMSQCIWDDQEPPAFLEEFQLELEAQTPKEEAPYYHMADRLTWMFIRFAKLRARMSARKIADLDAAIEAADLERGLLEWSSDAKERGGKVWEYYETEVEDSEHVWDGKILVYSSYLSAIIWNRWRCLRVLLSRVQELLCQRLVPADEREEYLKHFRRARRHMSNEICATIPPCLGHAGSTLNRPCALIAAYGCIWPLFFAGSNALERVGYGAWSIAGGGSAPPAIMCSSAYAQAAWILKQLKYIADEVGLKWADGIASPLRGEFVLQEPAPDNDYLPVVPDYLNDESDSLTQVDSWVAKVTTAYNSPWMEKIEQAYRRHHISDSTKCCLR